MANFSLLAKLGVDTKAFSRGLKTAQGRVSAFGKSAVGQFMKVGAAFAGIGLVKSMGSLALAAAETASKFESVFGPATAKMNEKVEELRQTIPSTTAEMQDALATFASMAKAFGLNSDAANTFSVELVKVAGDIASFHNLPIEEAFTKIRSAISGEFEPMKQLGIVINQARLEQEGLNLGIFDGVGQMNAAQKALAVQSIMIRDLGTANGDAASTANSAANQVKFLKKELAETGTEIGTTLLPAVTTLTGALSTMLTKIVEGTQNLGTFIGEMLFMGGMDEITFKAKLDLQAEGAFDDLPGGRGGTQQMQKMIEDRVALIKKEEAERKKAAEDRAKERDKEIQEAKDLGQTLEDQIATETDPARAKALKDRLKAFNDLIKAAGDLEGISAPKPKAGEGGEGGNGEALTEEEEKKKKLEALEEQIKDMKLEALREQAKGDKEAQAALEKRATLAQRILDIMREYNVSQEEATSLANKTGEEAEVLEGDKTGEEAEGEEGEKRSSLTGHDLKKAANIAGKGKAEDGKDIRFEKMGDGSFQQFVGGVKGKKFSEKEMQAGLQKQIDGEGDTNSLLEKINATLEGKFVSQ